MDQQKIGLILKELRKARSLTQEQLAARFHVSDRTVSRWENGNNLPDLATLVALADFYEVDLRALLDGERKPAQMEREAKETLAMAADYAGEERRQALRKTRRKSRRNTAIAVALIAVLLSPLLFLANVFFGNPASYLLARHNAKKWLDSRYRDAGFVITDGDYWFKDMAYTFRAEKPGSPDSTFGITFGMTGNYVYDTAEEVLEGHAGTKSRLCREYDALVREAFRDSPRYDESGASGALGEILFAGSPDTEEAGVPGLYETAVRADAQYDYALIGRTAGAITVSLETHDLSPGAAAGLLLECRALFDAHDVSFACITLLLTDRDADVQEGAGFPCAGVLHFPYAEIVPEDLPARVAAVMTE